MKIAYLINAHKNFKQLERLVARLNYDGADFFIHIDRKTDDTNFTLLLDALSIFKPTWVADRVDIAWARFSQVEATINGLRTILQSNKSYDYINFISGEDYPIKSNDYIADFFSKNNGYEFIGHFDPVSEGWAEGMARFQRYWLDVVVKNGRIRCLLQRAADFFPKRKIPKGYKAYAGSQWWSISSDCARYIVDFVDSNQSFVNFYKLTACPDEMFFQTIVMNSIYKTNVYNDNLRYIDWSEGQSHPKILTKNDFCHIKSSTGLFARKFDSNFDEEILDMIDDYINV